MIDFQQYRYLFESFDVPDPGSSDNIGHQVWQKLKTLPRDWGYTSIIWNLFLKDRKTMNDNELKEHYVTQFNNLKDNFDQYDSYVKVLTDKGIKEIRLGTYHFALAGNAGLQKMRSITGLEKILQALSHEAYGDQVQNPDFDETFKMEQTDLQNIKILGYSKDLVCFSTKGYETTNKFIYGIWRNSNMNTDYGHPEENSPFCTRMSGHWKKYSYENPDYEQFWFFLKPDSGCSATGPLTNKQCLEVYRKMARRGNDLLVGLDDTYGNANDRNDREIRDKFGKNGLFRGSNADSDTFRMPDSLGRDMTEQVKSLYGPAIKVNKTLDFPFVNIQISSEEGKSTVPPNTEERIGQIARQPLVVVPAEATSVADYAFGDGVEVNDRLEGVLMHDGILKIGDGAFQNCWKISSIDLPKNLRTVGRHAFSGTGITEVRVPGSIKNFRRAVFSYCGFLTDAVLEFGLETVPSSMFEGCHRLKNVVIPASAEGISNGAFWGCAGLENVEIPEELTYMGDNAFSGTGLKAVKLPGSLRHIGNCAFSSCPELKTAAVGRVMGDSMFRGCSRLEKIRMDDRLYTLPYRAFFGCRSLKDVRLPRFLETIGSGAFAGCASLEEMEIPENVEYIGDDVFSGCGNLKKITFRPKSFSAEYPSPGLVDRCPIEEFVVFDETSAGYAEKSGVPRKAIRLGKLDESYGLERDRVYSRMLRESFWR